MSHDHSEIRHRILGVMFTMTTYGTWLRGDSRGYVEDGVTYPADPAKQLMDRARLKYDPYAFEKARCSEIGERIGVH